MCVFLCACSFESERARQREDVLETESERMSFAMCARAFVYEEKRMCVLASAEHNGGVKNDRKQEEGNKKSARPCLQKQLTG